MNSEYLKLVDTKILTYLGCLEMESNSYYDGEWLKGKRNGIGI